MAEETSIQVNFGRPVPLFPLDSVVLLPQQVIPLHVFEPRYRQLVEDVLDSTGQFAMAVFEGGRWKQEYHGRPPLKPAVCLAQIIRHEKLEDGRYMLLIQGICRARISDELPPGDTLYRQAMIEPVGLDPDEEIKLYGVRERIGELLDETPLSKLAHADWVMEQIRNDDIPTSVILELTAFALPTSREVRYKLLAEGDAGNRAELITAELGSLKTLVVRAQKQHPEAWPKGQSWN